jgi:hypothetical protein
MKKITQNNNDDKQPKTTTEGMLAFLSIFIAFLSLIVTAYFGYLAVNPPSQRIPLSGTVVQNEMVATKNFRSTATRPNETMVLSVNPTISTEFGCVEWIDDFSNTEFGWGNGETDWGSWGHENGEYKVTVLPKTMLKRCMFSPLCESLNHKYFHIFVSARSTNNRGSWGIYFWDDEEGLFSFEIDEIGTVFINQYTQNHNITLATKPIKTLTTNRLELEYIDSKLSGFVNHEPAFIELPVTAVDGYYGVGILQSTFKSEYSSEVLFDDFSYSGCP